MTTAAATTLADVIALLQGMDLPNGPQLVSDVRSLCTYLGRTPDTVPAAFKSLGTSVDRIDPRACGIKRKRLVNVLASARRAVVLVNGRMAVSAHEPSVDGPWHSLYVSCVALRKSEGRCRWEVAALMPFMRFADAERLEVDEICASTFDAYASYINANRLCRKAKHRADEARAAWNRAVSLIPDWPQRVIVPERSRQTLRLDELPADLRADIDAYVSARGVRGTSTVCDDDFSLADDPEVETNADVDAPDADPFPDRPLATATLKLHVNILRECAKILTERGHVRLEAIRSIADLVSVRTMSALAQSGRRRGLSEATVRARTGALRDIAVRWTGPSATERAAMDRLLRKLVVKRVVGQLSTTPAVKLNGVLGTNGVPELLALPRKLVARCEKRSIRGVSDRDNCDMQVAVALVILFAVPLRAKNLSELRIGETLLLGNGRRAPAQIRLGSADTKNAVPIFANLGDEATSTIKLYVEKYRSAHAKAGNEYLFPGREGSGKKLQNSLARLVTKTIRVETEMSVSLHLFRYLAATLVFKHTGGRGDTVSALLGHAPGTKTWAGYTFGMRERGRVPGRGVGTERGARSEAPG
jgi:integrase